MQMFWKTYFFSGAFIVLYFVNSCDSNETITTETTDSSEVLNVPIISELNLDTLKGIYIGDFGGSDLRLVINYITNKHAVGYNTHKGLQRNINGSVEIKESTVDLVLSEPGDNEFDGVFHLSINKESLDAEGYWQSNSVKISKKHFVLKKLSGMRVMDKIAGINKDVKLTPFNFSDYFSVLSDSIGEISFEENGLCIYKYYPNTDESERKEQYISFNGSWTLKTDQVIVEWQKNNIFPNRKSIFNIIKSGDENADFYYDTSLEGENRKFTNDQY